MSFRIADRRQKCSSGKSTSISDPSWPPEPSPCELGIANSKLTRVGEFFSADGSSMFEIRTRNFPILRSSLWRAIVVAHIANIVWYRYHCSCVGKEKSWKAYAINRASVMG
ncbi:hypothetical protein BDV96DRAFT_562605 [Lophiotrema nucula]|uniref:Uncharacterized protein n=1 Tax=Lophiotrema nucula TaxID=690887 RepID=A0A6A5ZU86_9PLEO|nr:hypothetical protein BDV96DRAFT_562605 [Lophiotrema nucula]